jgi:hypothetical protein
MSEYVKLRNFELYGTIVIIVLATILTAIFSNMGTSVPNGSAFIIIKHLSLFQIAQYMFTAIIIYSAIEYLFFGDEFRNFYFAKAAAAFSGPTIFLLLTYLFTVTVGYTDRTFYIATFIIGAVLAQYLSYYFLREGIYFRLMNAYGVAMVALLLLVFFAYSNTRFVMSPLFEPLSSYERKSNNNPYY